MTPQSDIPSFSRRHRQADQRGSIRDRLEQDAWSNHRAYAEWRARRNPLLTDRERTRGLRWQDRVLLGLSIFLLLLLIVRVESAQAQEELWGLEFIGDGQRQRSLALDTDIYAEVTGLVARVSVTQVFENTGQSWSEAVYRYPLPAGVAVDRMVVEVGNRVLEGEIREKELARRQYQQARNDGHVASLVEQHRASQFETRLANIGPGERVRVYISYMTRVEFRDETFSLAFPMTFTPRWNHPSPVLMGGFYDELAPTPALTSGGGLDDHFLTLNIDLQPAVTLASIESRYHDVEIHPSLNGYNVFLSNPDARTDRVFQLDWKPVFGATPESSLMTWDSGDAVYAMLMMAPPLEEAISPQPREVVFIIDTSGSMEGVSIVQAKAALRQGLNFLGEDDRFNLVHFNSDAWLLFDESVPAYTTYLAEAEAFIDHLSANGGTNMAPALDLALNLPEQPDLLRQVVFITDGSVGNEGELLLQIGEELRESRLFTVSIGSAPNAGFMQKAAEIGRGNHTQIGRAEEVQERMTQLWSRIQSPALKNLCVDWGMDAEFHPSIIPDLYAGEPLWLFARLPAQPSEVLLCGELDGQPWQQRSWLMPGDGSETLATLWARSKIESLEDSRIFGIHPDTIRQDVTELALAYGLLTPYTSLVAVDRTPSRPTQAMLDSEVVPSLLPAGSTATATGFSQTATGWVAQVLLSLLSLLVATGMMMYSSPSRVQQAGGARSPMVHSSP